MVGLGSLHSSFKIMYVHTHSAHRPYLALVVAYPGREGPTLPIAYVCLQLPWGQPLGGTQQAHVASVSERHHFHLAPHGAKPWQS